MISQLHTLANCSRLRSILTKTFTATGARESGIETSTQGTRQLRASDAAPHGRGDAVDKSVGSRQSCRNSWRRRWSRSSSAMMLPLSTRCVTRLTVALRAAEAKMQLGAASVDTQMQDIEREALGYAAAGHRLLMPTSEIWVCWVPVSACFNSCAHCPPKAKRTPTTSSGNNGTGDWSNVNRAADVSCQMLCNPNLNRFMAEFPKFDLRVSERSVQGTHITLGNGWVCCSYACVQDITPLVASSSC